MEDLPLRSAGGVQSKFNICNVVVHMKCCFFVYVICAHLLTLISNDMYSSHPTIKILGVVVQ